LQRLIMRGTCTYIVDSHFTTQETINGMREILPAPPFSIVFDMDPVPNMCEFTNIKDIAIDFFSFLRDVVNVRPILIHSGNKSYHIRLDVSWDDDQLSYLLPKVANFDTYRRRYTGEHKILFARHSAQICALAYRYWKGSKWAKYCSFPVGTFNKNRQIMNIDIRCGTHVGFRAVTSFNINSGGYCRLFPNINQLPESELELQALCSQEYLQKHLNYFTHPEITEQTLNSNSRNLLEFTNDFYGRKFSQLVYSDRIFH